MFRFLKVTGESLSPEYREGDFVLVVKIPFFFSQIRGGDTVVFKHPAYGTLIKKVERLSPDGTQLFVVGTHSSSVDSRQFGAVSSDTVIGKVIWHISKPAVKS